MMGWLVVEGYGFIECLLIVMMNFVDLNDMVVFSGLIGLFVLLIFVCFCWEDGIWVVVGELGELCVCGL